MNDPLLVDWSDLSVERGGSGERAVSGYAYWGGR